MTKTGLLMVDVQRDMLEGENPVPSGVEVRSRLEALLLKARRSGALVVHVQNDGGPGDPDAPGTDGWALVFAPLAGEPVVRKSVGNAFSNAELPKALRQHGVTRVVVAGMQSEHCVSDTSRGALRSGLQVVLACGAHATYDQDGRSAESISMRVEEELSGEGVRLTPSEQVSF